MSLDRWTNLVSMFFAQAERGGDTPFLWHKRDGAYRPLSWRETAAQVRALAGGLAALGIGRGDRLVVVSENRPEWMIADLAAMSLGAITTPAYITNTADDHHHILTNSGARGAIVSSRRFLSNVLPAAARAPELRFVISLDGAEDARGYQGRLLRWDEALAAGKPAGTADWSRDDVACIIYTSGTGGRPKGVMLHHGAMLHNCESFTEALAELDFRDEVFLSFLPLSHSYEHTLGQFWPIHLGAQIYYVDGVQNLVTNLAEAHPTLLISVPRLYEMMRERLLREMSKSAPGEADFGDTMKAKARAMFGGRMKAMIAGGAPLNPDIGAFFEKLGLCILQGYGQTESGPVVGVNLPRRPKHHTIGPALPRTEVRIADDGELLVRGELVMKGYWRDPEKTAATVVDGWLHTGDVARIDEDGYIQITDRKKDIIVNSGGDNISPQRVEGILTMAAEIAQAMVYGDRRPHLVSLLVPDPTWLQAWAAEHGKAADLGALKDDPELRKAIAEVLSRINGSLSNIEKVRRFVVADAPFSIDNGQLTPTSKVRRHAVIQAYKDRLEALYG